MLGTSFEDAAFSKENIMNRISFVILLLGWIGTANAETKDKKWLWTIEQSVDGNPIKTSQYDTKTRIVFGEGAGCVFVQATHTKLEGCPVERDKKMLFVVNSKTTTGKGEWLNFKTTIPLKVESAPHVVRVSRGGKEVETKIWLHDYERWQKDMRNRKGRPLAP